MTDSDFEARRALALTYHPSVVSSLNPGQRKAVQGFARALTDGKKFQVVLQDGQIVQEFSPRRFNFPQRQVVGISGSSIKVLHFAELASAEVI